MWFVVEIGLDVARIVGGAPVRNIEPQDFFRAGGEDLVAPEAARPRRSLRKDQRSFFQNEDTLSLSRQLVSDRRTAGAATDNYYVVLGLHWSLSWLIATGPDHVK